MSVRTVMSMVDLMVMLMVRMGIVMTLVVVMVMVKVMMVRELHIMMVDFVVFWMVSMT